MINKFKVSAVVLNWNNFTDTFECILSLKRSVIPFYKIIMVDNNSTDGSFESLYNCLSGDEMIVLIRNKQNVGFAAGVNIGIKIAIDLGSDYIFLINNDAVIEPNTILCLLEASSNEVGILGPRIYYYDNRSKIWQGGGYFNYLKAGVSVPEKNSVREIFTENTEVSFLTGCAMLISTKCIEDVGLFNENYFFYYEDVDYCIRASRRGFKLIYVPQAKVYHKIKDVKKERTSPFVFFHLAKSFIIFIYSNFNALYFLYSIFLHFFIYTPYRIYQVMYGSKDVTSIKAWFKGTIEGLKFVIKSKR